jgi:MscS family membrane protein
MCIVALLTAVVLLHCAVAIFIQNSRQYSLVNPWILALFYAAKRPVQALLWAEGLLLAGDFLSRFYQFPFFGDFLILKKVSVSVSFVWFLFRSKRAYQRLAVELDQKKEIVLDPMLFSALSKLATVVIVLFSVVTVLHVVGIPLESLMVFGGAVSIAVGFAGTNVIANFFGGLMVYVNRPFKVGDWIRSPDKEIEGHVEEIGWYSTRIRTFERQILYVPNSIFTQIVLQNPSQMYNRRIRQTIGLRYQDLDKVEVVVKDIETMLKNHPEIDQQQQLMVHWVAFGKYSLDIDLYAFTRATDWSLYRSVQQDVFLQSMKIILDHGADVAFPVKDVYRIDGKIEQ